MTRGNGSGEIVENKTKCERENPFIGQIYESSQDFMKLFTLLTCDVNV